MAVHDAMKRTSEMYDFGSDTTTMIDFNNVDKLDWGLVVVVGGD